MAGNYVTNTEPYVLRPSAGDIRSTSKFIGGTVAWNQLFKEVSSSNWIYADASLGSATFSDGECAYTTLSEGASYRNGIMSRQGTFGIVDHKYIVYAEAKASRDGITIGGDICNIGFTFTRSLASSYQAFYKIVNCTSAQNAFLCLRGGHQINDVVTFKNLMLIDLTAMFGSTIADYIYSLETATAGAGVAFFRSLFPNDYYPYDAGTLKSVEGVSAHVTTGFNQWDEEWEVGSINNQTGQNTSATSQIRSKNYFRVFPNAEYYGSIGTSGLFIWFYDADKNYIAPNINATNRTFVTPANAHYARLATWSSSITTTEYRHDICINLSDASRNGEYEPYSKHSYPLDSTLTLRGIPKLDSANHLYYDGDTYESDGTVTRRYKNIVVDGNSNVQTGASGMPFRLTIDDKKQLQTSSAAPNSISDKLTGVTQASTWGVPFTFSFISQHNAMYFKLSDDIAAVADAKTYLASNPITLVYELATPTTETARSFAASHVVNKYGTEGFAYDEDVLPVPVGHETTYLSKEDKSEKGEYLNAAGLSYFWEKVKSFFAKRIGFPEAPYKEVEWVESNGKQFVYLDWHPPIATWGFEADFLIKNAFNTTQAAWNASTNASNAGFLFGTQNSSTVNDIQLGTYSTYGFFRLGNGTNQFSTSGRMKTDKSRQTIKLIGTTLTGANGTAVTVSRASETSGKPYANMALFCYHSGLRRASSGNVTYPSTTRIYSLKFYEGTTVVVDLVGAIRKCDGVTGLYDKIAGHFYPAPGMTYGNDVGDLGSTETVLETAKNTIIQGTANNITHRRMWTVNVPTLSKLVDGQKFSITPMYTVAASVESDLSKTEDSGNNTYVYLKLTLANGNTTDWIPCYYMGTSRLTSHYGAGHPILFTYRENVFYGATDTASGNTIMCGMFADPNYNTDRTYDVYSDTVIAGANGIKRYTLCMQDSTGKWTSIVNEANSSGATGKTCYTGGLRLGKVLYHSAGAEYASGANSGTMWQTYAFDARYSMNGIANAASTTLEMRKPFYLVGTLHSDGLFYLDTTKWWTQTEPTTEDGKVYLLVGWAYSSYYAVYLAAHNPAYVFKNGKLQELTNTHVVDVDVPANAKFTDTVTTATTSGSGNAVTAITASNGALTVTKGTTFLTSHQDISGKADKSATVSTVAWDSTNKKLTKTINGSTTDVVTAATLRTGLNVADGAEVNQNAFSNVKVGSTTVAADAKTDTLELVAGSNVTLTPDATNDKVTIAATDTTYGVATGSKDGLMSSGDFTKLSGIATGAEVNQNAFSNVKVGSTTVSADSKTDTLELAAGTNITLTPDATNDKVTIATSAEVNQNAFSNVKVGSTTVAADSKTDTLELAAGTNITLTPDATNDKVTIAATDTKYSAGTGLSLSGTTFSNAIKTRNDLMSLQSKTYTGVIGSTNDDAGTYLYCMKVLPTSYNASWEITYRVTATITGVSEANGSGYETSIVHICGMRDTYSAYSTWNEVSHTSYRPYYYHCIYRAKAAGITGGYGHLLGISLRYSYNPVTAANARTVSFDILETKGCTATFFDAPTKYASCPGTGSTNYSAQTAFDGTTQGMTMSGDRNDPNYTVRNYYGCRTTYTAMYRYQFCATRKDRTLLPMNTVNNSVATNKTLTTEAFDPFGDFLFWNSTTTYSAGANVGDGWYAQYVADFRYSFNIGGYNTASTLVARKPVYLVCTPQSDGTVKLHSAPLAQELPTTEDNKLYIYIGQVYPDTYPYRVYISILHPIYWYKNGAVRLYTGSHYSAGTGISISTDNVITNSGVTDISWDSDSGMLKKTKNGSVSIVTPLSTAALTGSYDDLSDKPTISTLGGIPTSQKAAANGVASLGSDGKVPGAQLPDNSNLSAVEARVTALEGLLNVVESWSPSSGYSIASSSSWSAALGSKAFQLAKGTYIVMFGADFSSNASGYRMVQINTSAAGNRYTPSSPPVNGNNTRLMGTVLLQPTATTNYYMYVFQNSGATLTVTPWARIIKIG